MARKNPHGIVVLPPGSHSQIDDESLRKWLSRGQVTCTGSPVEALLRVLGRLGEPAPGSGLAALRFWGQTGDRSGAWMAAADPMHLETRLHSLTIGALGPDELQKSELRQLFDYLQCVLGGESGFSFARIGRYGYVHGEGSLETASMSASLLHGLPPNEFIPSGSAATGYHQLLGEIQMALHEHDVNRQRSELGLPVINSLWLWGGGRAPEPAKRPLPTLYANDPLFRGYWLSCAGEVAAWDGDVETLANRSASAFVAVMPEFSPCPSAEALKDCLAKMQRLLRYGAVRSLTLLFHDGLTVEISRRDALSFWRRPSPLLKKPVYDD